MSQAVRSLLGVALVLATAAPLLRDARHDSFPFSTYPMFARVLTRPLLTYAEGLTRSGRAVRLPPELVANDEPMQAMRTLKLTAKEGEQALEQLCGAIAERTARSPAHRQVLRVRIARASFDPLRYFETDAPAPEQESLVECRVKRRR